MKKESYPSFFKATCLERRKRSKQEKYNNIIDNIAGLLANKTQQLDKQVIRSKPKRIKLTSDIWSGLLRFDRPSVAIRYIPESAEYHR